MRFSSRLTVLLFVCLALAAFGAACGSSDNSKFSPGSGDDASTGDATTGDDGPGLGDDGSNLGGGDASSVLTIAPANKTIDVNYGQSMPTVQYTATVQGKPVAASFAIDRGEIGSMNASTGVMTPTGNVGGTAHVTAAYNGQMASTTVTVRLHMTQNGASAGADAGGGAGGNGGVGGEGEGGQVSGQGQVVLQGTAMPDAGLSWLYPYDKTVWPRGVLAPLLQWNAPRNYDAVFIDLKEAAFEFQGFFSATATPFIHHPVPQQAWQTLAYSNQGEDVQVTLVFSSGGVAYGPLVETWKIAQATLTGTVYYNSYGTALVTNYCAGTSWGPSNYCFGGATLAIKHGATSPVLVAGTNSPPGDDSGCRVCHSVAAQGATLVTEHGNDYNESSSYALTSGNAETVMAPANGTFAFPAIYPDGTFLFANMGPLPGVSPSPSSGLFAIPSGAPISSTGLPAQNFNPGTPVFSPDGHHVAYNDYANAAAPQRPLASLDFDPATKTFSNQQTLDTPPSGQRDLFPAFLPTNDAVIFEREVANDGEYGATRNGSEGELWWVDLKTHTATRLDNLNGKGYVPTGPNNHGDDTVLQYEPTVNPVPSGGYAWVVFTSRRMYGNIANQDPFLSDPRNYDPATGITTKKLWVAAIDLNAKPGTDPSHPAFYLPGQELHAGNSRGYWVVDPCMPNGSSCQTGDECCGGYCEDVDGGIVCSSQPPACSNLNDKCTTTSDCCGASQGIQCINGRCAMSSPP